MAVAKKPDIDSRTLSKAGKPGNGIGGLPNATRWQGYPFISATHSGRAIYRKPDSESSLREEIVTVVSLHVLINHDAPSIRIHSDKRGIAIWNDRNNTGGG